jgi:uncharacterized protein YrrD
MHNRVTVELVAGLHDLTFSRPITTSRGDVDRGDEAAPIRTSSDGTNRAHQFDSSKLVVRQEDRVRRVSEYVGKPIVSADNGEKIGNVTDVLADGDAGRLIGVIVGGGILSSEQVLPYADVQTLGTDAVIARSQEHIVGAREWHKTGTDAVRLSTFKNRRVITIGGRELGAVRDVQVDEQSGTVTAYDVAGPALTRLLERRGVLSRSAGVTVGPDALVVSEEVAREFEAELRAGR